MHRGRAGGNGCETRAVHQEGVEGVNAAEGGVGEEIYASVSSPNYGLSFTFWVLDCSRARLEQSDHL